MKKVVAACIERVLEFDSPEEAAAYVEGIREKGSEFQVLSRENEGGKCRVRIREQYNKTPPIKD